VRERDEDSIAVGSTSSDDLAQRNASPEPIDRERADEEDDARPHERELSIEPRRTERGLGRRRTSIPRSARGLSRKALRDRRAIREIRFIDPSLGEPAPQLRAGAS
jgi:hypothetical protein